MKIQSNKVHKENKDQLSKDYSKLKYLNNAKDYTI